jgi:phage-related protein
MSPRDKPLIWIGGSVTTPPFSEAARLEAGFLLRQVQAGEVPPMPHSRPMPGIGAGCHELRVQDKSVTWRLVYRLEADCVLLLEVFEKKTAKTPKPVVATCRQRIRDYARTRDPEK